MYPRKNKDRSDKEKTARGSKPEGALRRWLQRDSREVVDDLRKGLAARRGATPPPATPAESAQGEAAGQAPAEPVPDDRKAPAGQGAPAPAPVKRPLPRAIPVKRPSFTERARSVMRGWGSALAGAASSVWRRFPVGLTGKERLEALPPPGSTWYRLLLVVTGGALLWTLTSALLQRRLFWVSLVVALVVAAGVVVSLGTRFGPPVGILGMALAILSLLTGELAVQLLHRYGVIDKLDLAGLRGGLEQAAPFYRAYYYNLVVHRLLPPALLAFLVGLWPLKVRPYWRGFGGGE